jgi:hypothetical protein
MARRYDPLFSGKRYCGNTNTKEVHDLDHEHTNCQIDAIVQAGHVRVFIPDSLEQAHSEGYDNCSYCLGFFSEVEKMRNFHMYKQKEAIRFNIDGKWSAEDMAKSIMHTDDLYKWSLMFEIVNRKNDKYHFYEEFCLSYPKLYQKATRRKPSLSRRRFLELEKLFVESSYRKPQVGSEIMRFERENLKNIEHAILTTLLESREALSSILDRLYPYKKLEIIRIEYGSPGFQDFLGVGTIVGHIKDFIIAIIEHRAMRERRNLENERIRQEIRRLQLENAREFIRLATEIGIPYAKLKKHLAWVEERQETFINLIEDGKILSVNIHSDKL